MFPFIAGLNQNKRLSVMVPINSPLSKLVFLLLFPLHIIRYSLHILFAYMHRDFSIIMQEANIQADDYQIFARMRDSRLRTLLRFIWALHYNPHYLACFYGRIRTTRAWLCSIFKRSHYHFVLDVDYAGILHLHHPFSTIVNAKRVGNHVIIRHNTTIGNKGTSHEKGERPVIGNHVDIGAGVIIFGNITIGDNVIIGAGSLINKDIPSDSVVVGNPFRFIKQASNGK